ncbi:MAG: hypothetical protein MUE81_12500 [Thermoflexibacter sp.]|jgi:hypothetical protein|nr:hypothetical protein [Thermoflexibacter sp.]
MEYRFSKDFLAYSGEVNFADIWEKFCCKLLNIYYRTDEIYRREAPENGVDLFFPSRKIAFQCKSVESANSKGHNLQKIKESYLNAKKIQNEIRWSNYFICLNYGLTGIQEKKLKQELPEVTVFPQSFWLNICETYPTFVENNFRKLISIHGNTISSRIKDSFTPEYSMELSQKLKENKFDIYVYSEKHNKLYRLGVSGRFKIIDLLEILINIWKLPQIVTENYGFNGIKIHYDIIFNDEVMPFYSTLEELNIYKHSVICLYASVTYENNGKILECKQMYKTSNYNSKDKMLKKCIFECEKSIRDSLQVFDNLYLEIK